MMTKKRNEEGYVLVYVMVVIFVLCSIAIAIMSYTLNTLQAQEAMVRRMKDKYEAMGEIERVVAELDIYSVPELTDSKYKYSTESDCAEDAIEYLLNYIDDFNYSFASTEDTPERQLSISPHDTADPNKYTFSITTKYASTQVDAKLVIFPNIKTHHHITYTKNENGDDVIDSEWYQFTIDVDFFAFDSYNIVSGGEAA